jgi:hypothetical protein
MTGHCPGRPWNNTCSNGRRNAVDLADLTSSADVWNASRSKLRRSRDSIVVRNHWFVVWNMLCSNGNEGLPDA